MKHYFVEYNAQYMGMYKRLASALNLIKRKGYRNDYDNCLRLFDSYGNEYNPITGKEIVYPSY